MTWLIIMHIVGVEVGVCSRLASMVDIAGIPRKQFPRSVRVVPVYFGERHDTRTNAADRRPTNQISAWQAGRGSRPPRRTRRHPREDPIARMSGVSGVSARMSRRCYEETASMEFKVLNTYAHTPQ